MAASSAEPPSSDVRHVSHRPVSGGEGSRARSVSRVGEPGRGRDERLALHAGTAPGDTGPAGGLIFYVNPNYAADGWRYLEAAPVDQSLGAKWGCFRKALAGARGAGVGDGRQNTADMLAACAERGSAADLCANYVLNGIGGWFLPSTRRARTHVSQPEGDWRR